MMNKDSARKTFKDPRVLEGMKRGDTLFWVPI